MNLKEAALRKALGIPESATSVLIMEQSAHCDWDWVSTFDTYYFPGGGYNPRHQAVRTTLEEAISYIGTGITSSLPYTYVYCEVAYLQKFMGDPTVKAALKHDLKEYAKSGAFLFSSGGITSAENLTLHPEAFIRNYLLGRQWLMGEFGVTASNQMWIPDDFGHDAQLPVLLQAMGFTGAGFWRIPAQVGAANNGCDAAAGTADAPGTYLKSDVGFDFLWQARDGSKIQAHWLANGYCEGNNVLGSGGTADEQDISKLIEENTTAVMATEYMFVPIDCDFAIPYSNGAAIVEQWNTQSPPSSTWVVQASFDSFMQLVAAATTQHDGTSSLQTVYTDDTGPLPPFVPHPYYSGCYASKPFIKNTHYQVVRSLLFTESMQLILQSLAQTDPSYWAPIAGTALTKLATAWNDIAPSTHHDYIPGTAPNGTCGEGADVYDDEQVTRLQQANDEALGAQSYVVSNIANAITVLDRGGVAIFNGLGFARQGIADLTTLPIGGPFPSVTADGTDFFPTQDDGNGGLLIPASVGSLGYSTLYLSQVGADSPVMVEASLEGGVVTMSNGSISAQITAAGVIALSASGSSASILSSTDPGNQLCFYSDNGNIYRFGNELPCYPPNYPDAQFALDASMTFDDATISVTEDGPLRATAVVSGTVNGATFSVQYQLYATDTALRISVTGAAPQGYSVMVRFPFTGTAASLTYGTTAHWDTQAPRNYFVGPMPSGVELITFEPTHEYVCALDSSNNALGAIYHYATPAWGIDSSGALLGCLLRNVPGGQNAACADDPGTYTVTYAVALPGAPSMLGAALDINNPLVAVGVPFPSGGLPASMSIASTDGGALITAAKAGTVNPSQLILRFHQPTNAPMNGVTVTLDATIAAGYQDATGSLTASSVNALEQPSPLDLGITATSNTVQLNLQYAITTLALGESG
jgi:alpha-mannosidase